MPLLSQNPTSCPWAAITHSLTQKFENLTCDRSQNYVIHTALQNNQNPPQILSNSVTLSTVKLLFKINQKGKETQNTQKARLQNKAQRCLNIAFLLSYLDTVTMIK